MFRRFRQRRAIRAMEKKKKYVQQQNEPTLLSSSRQTDSTIFRSVNSTSTFIPSIPTTASSFSSDDVENNNNVQSPKSSTLLNISCTSFAKGILLDSHDHHETFVMDVTEEEQQQKHCGSTTTNKGSPKNNLRSVLDNIQNEIFVTDEVKEQLLASQIELAFMKESYNDIQTKLQQAQTLIERQQLELTIGRIAIKYTEQELDTTKIAFRESVSSLVDMKMSLLILQEQLTLTTNELTAVKESIPFNNNIHRSSAQIIASFLSVGTILTTNNTSITNCDDE